jgi:hypothetical protein
MSTMVMMQPPAGQSMPAQINFKDGTVIYPSSTASVPIPSQHVADLLAAGWSVVARMFHNEHFRPACVLR